MLDAGPPLVSLESLMELRAFADAQPVVFDPDVVSTDTERKESKVARKSETQGKADRVAVKRTDPVDASRKRTQGTRKGSGQASVDRGKSERRKRRGHR